MTNCEPETWGNCYPGTFDLITPESFAHPAKMSAALCYRIIDHLESLGLLRPGMTILDPLGGIGTTALCATARGYKAVTVELEEKFVGIQKANREYAARRLHREIDWTILQGDSRYLSTLLAERGLVTVTSPPYQDSDGHPSLGSVKTDDWGKEGTDIVSRRGLTGKYGDNPANIGNLPARPITITSPPYADAINSETKGGIDWLKCAEGARPDKLKPSASQGTDTLRYGTSDGQIGQLPDKRNTAGSKLNTASLDPNSYLGSMALIYAEIGKVSNVLAVVTKNPTRAGKLRRLDLDTIALLEQTGWHILCTHKAQLFTEHETQDLFGQTHKKVRGRMSFFKRLQWRKGNSEIADHEDVIFAVRRQGAL